MEVFTRAATQFAGAFSADQGRMSFGAGVSTALVQTVSASFMQNVTRLYEVGSNGDGKANIYYVGGRSQGTLSIQRVVGPGTLIAAYYLKFGDVCEAAGNTIELIFNPLHCDGEDATYTLKYCVITMIGISTAAQDLVVNESSQLMFSGLEYDDDDTVAL